MILKLEKYFRLHLAPLTRTHLPGDVGLPAPPGLAEVLQDGPGLVLLDALGHHVQNVVHDGSTQLQVKVGLHALLSHRLGHALGVTPWGRGRGDWLVMTHRFPMSRLHFHV